MKLPNENVLLNKIFSLGTTKGNNGRKYNTDAGVISAFTDPVKKY